MGIVGVRVAQNQRQCGQRLGKRRMLFVETQVEPLQIADASADMRDLVEGDRLPQRRTAGQYEKERQQQDGGNGEYSAIVRLGQGLPL